MKEPNKTSVEELKMLYGNVDDLILAGGEINYIVLQLPATQVNLHMVKPPCHTLPLVVQ